MSLHHLAVMTQLSGIPILSPVLLCMLVKAILSLFKFSRIFAFVVKQHLRQYFHKLEGVEQRNSVK